MRVLVLLLLGVLPLTSALAATAPLTQPNAYAVVIGISQYREEVIPKVAYAVKDAEAMAQMLEKQAGIPKSHIKLMTDGHATSADFHKLGDWLKIKVRQPDATVYVYYAGHGTPNTKTSEPYLVPWDGDPDFPETLYPLKSLYAALEQLPSTNILVFLDSCFSGAEGRSVLAKGARPMVLSMDAPLAASKKVIVLAAATGNQLSSDYDRAEHGLFTYAVLTGLRGAADKDKDGMVTVRELFPYVREQVSATAAEELTREQTPVLLPGEQILGARSAMPVAMVIPGTSDVLKKPMISLSQAEQERQALEAQEQAVDAEAKQADVQRENEERRRRIEDKKKKLEVASLPSYSAPKDVGREITGKDGAKMRLIPAGEFMMGSTEGEANEKPVHRVGLDAFYLDQYEVTNQLFQKFARETGYETTAEKEGKAWAYVSDETWTEVSGANWRKPEGGETVFVSNREAHPVVSVSWHDAEAYCRHYGQRLPTEAEFEYALRAGTQTTYWWGDGNPGSRRVANLADLTNKRQFPGRPWPIMEGYDDGYARTAPVGSYEPNPFGLYDMTGNAAEWTGDWYGETYYQTSPSRNPTGAANGTARVLRGGSWSFTPRYVRSAYRGNWTPGSRIDSIGFRCAKTP